MMSSLMEGAESYDAVSALRRAGEAAFGEAWQRPLARALTHIGVEGKVTDRQVRFWVSGQRRVPSSIIRALPIVLGGRAQALRGEAHRCAELANQLMEEIEDAFG